MQSNLINYLSERYQKGVVEKKQPGPVITFSREAGCPAKKIAEKLSVLLNGIAEAKGKEALWHWISKDIMLESAKQLDLNPSDIEYVFNYEDRTLIHDILLSHSSKYYKSDRIIKKTIAHVIRTLADRGNVIVIGRGGIAITRDMERSFHVHFEAPLEWRAIMIAEKFNISQEEAVRYAQHIDQKREEFRNFFEGKKTDYTWFDMKINCMTLSVDEIAQVLAKAIELRKLV
jgi:cytidylate kinase